MNLSSRKDYIEPDYVNGTFDKDGNKVIRELNDSEKAFLNQFYEETVVTNFYHNSDLQRLNKYKKTIVEDKTVRAILSEIKELNVDRKKNSKRIRELREIVRITKKQNEELYAEELEFLEEELQDLRKEKLLYPNKEDHKEFYNANNSRNNCIFNKSRITSRLVSLDTDEYDNYMSNQLEGVDTEKKLIQELEREMYEQQEERFESIVEEVKKVIKKKMKLLKSSQ